ncbi:MAG: hypothetical protein L6R40_008593 [Gallowayella cf. fulva]|nr:MAG: hypothetical protein L6R40_008593 [Xanthomendoza cf. fulva]
MAEKLLPKSTPKASHGRGNIGPTVNDASKSPLTTPTIKSTVYTTGRGGSGNMKKNDPQHPEIARQSQDVVVVCPAIKRRPSGNAEERSHTGRGGAANIIRPTSSIDAVPHTADEKNAAAAVIEEGKSYDRQRNEAGGQGATQGDWWRDELAGASARRR